MPKRPNEALPTGWESVWHQIDSALGVVEGRDPDEVLPTAMFVFVREMMRYPWSDTYREDPDRVADIVERLWSHFRNGESFWAGRGYLSKSEVETAHRYIDQFRKDHHGDTLVLLAGQPYNVDFWKPDFLKSIGIEPSKQPEAVEVRAKGNFAEVKNYLRPAEWKALKDAGFDGAWVRGGFSTEPQLVIWNRNAITRFGDWKPSADITMNQTRNAEAPEFVYHISPSENRASIQEHGLLGSKSQASETGIYFDTLPTHTPGFDTWKVDVRGLGIEPDESDTSGSPEFADHGWWAYYEGDIPSERLSLMEEQTMNQARATKETAKPKVQDLMAEALKHRPSQPTLSEVTKDIAARAPSVVP